MPDFYKEYKYQGNMSRVIPLISILLTGVMMFYISYENKTRMTIEGIELIVEATKISCAISGVVCFAGLLLMIFVLYLGRKIKRNVVLTNDRLIFPKNNFSAERMTRRYSEIASISHIRVDGRNIVKIMYFDGGKREFSCILFDSKEEFLDFLTNLMHLKERDNQGTEPEHPRGA